VSGGLPLCKGCSKPLESGRHLRTQVAPPQTPWREVRTCNLHCLIDYLQDEEDKLDAKKTTDIGWSREVPSARRPAAVTGR